jgi:hypothetical protein
MTIVTGITIERWQMKDERWKMKNERWTVKDEKDDKEDEFEKFEYLSSIRDIYKQRHPFETTPPFMNPPGSLEICADVSKCHHTFR